ncbi:hypothetical protein JW978_02050 [Candidatus Dojkabacteria bacterium]|nr:hypothetical protein [Candidatus Dojkabacteria bacterium]
MTTLSPEQQQNITDSEPGILDLIGENPGQIKVIDAGELPDLAEGYDAVYVFGPSDDQYSGVIEDYCTESRKMCPWNDAYSTKLIADGKNPDRRGDIIWEFTESQYKYIQDLAGPKENQAYWEKRIWDTMTHLLPIIYETKKQGKNIAMAFCPTETPIFRDQYSMTTSSIELRAIRAFKEARWDLPDIYFVQGVYDN